MPRKAVPASRTRTATYIDFDPVISAALERFREDHPGLTKTACVHLLLTKALRAEKYLEPRIAEAG